MNNDFVSVISHGDNKYLIKWDKQSNVFTIEGHDKHGQNGYIVIFNGAINDIVSELQKLQELIDKPRDRLGV